MLYQKISLFLCGIQATVPSLCGVRLILNGQAGDLDASPAVFVNVFADISGPKIRILKPELAAAIAAAVGFHKGGRRPGRQHDR